jgi:hypothetical protein
MEISVQTDAWLFRALQFANLNQMHHIEGIAAPWVWASIWPGFEKFFTHSRHMLSNFQHGALTTISTRQLNWDSCSLHQ